MTTGLDMGSSNGHPVAVMWRAWQDERAGARAIAERQQRRLQDLVVFARTCSPLYRDRYAGLPTTIDDIRLLPPVTKPELMADFDRWVTDPAVTRTGVERFVADPTQVGARYLDRYTVWTTSGTTGEPALLVHDQRSWTVLQVLARLRGLRGFVGPQEVRAIVRGGARSAAVFVTGGHFGGVVLVERQRRLAPWFADHLRTFSAATPLRELVAQLNDFQPVVLGGYPSALTLLAGEQAAGRLRLRPALLSCAGEHLSCEARTRIERSFGCRVRDGYGASETGAIALACSHDRLHVQSDWIILEPVDRDLQPVAPGVPSHTVLLTGLANRVQPIIRYDLGDAVTMEPEACPCGSPLPSVSVVGRTNDVLVLHGRHGSEVRLLPLALGAVVEETAGVRRFQVIQNGASTLAVRVDVAPGADPDAVWTRVATRLEAHLETHGVAAVDLQRDPRPPATEPRSGKFRQVYRQRATVSG